MTQCRPCPPRDRSQILNLVLVGHNHPGSDSASRPLPGLPRSRCMGSSCRDAHAVPVSSMGWSGRQRHADPQHPLQQVGPLDQHTNQTAFPQEKQLYHQVPSQLWLQQGALMLHRCRSVRLHCLLQQVRLSVWLQPALTAFLAVAQTLNLPCELTAYGSQVRFEVHQDPS